MPRLSAFAVKFTPDQGYSFDLKELFDSCPSVETTRPHWPDDAGSSEFGLPDRHRSMEWDIGPRQSAGVGATRLDRVAEVLEWRGRVDRCPGLGGIELLQHCVFVLVGWRTTAEEFQDRLACIGDLVKCSGRDGDGVARNNVLALLADPHQPFAFENVVDLLGLHVVMAGRRGTRRKPRFGQRLVLDARVAISQ